MFCHFCKCEFAERAISTHLRFKHHISLKEYYDKFFKTTSEGLCENCGKLTKFNGTHGYQRFCSVKCGSAATSVKEKRKLYNMEHYGGNAPSCSFEVKEKMKTTCLAKYGNEWTFQVDQVKEKIKKSKENLDMASVIAKWKNTKLMKYGDENFNNRRQAAMTKLEKYENEHFVNPEKAKQTRIRKYGVDHHLQLDEYKEKQKLTFLERYGVEHALQLDEFKEKMTFTCLERYGVEHALQNHEIFCKTKRKYEYDGIKFDSKPEIELYKKLKDENANFEYQPNVCFEYEYAGKTHKYFPDFRIGNEYVELKGSHFIENGKMINPFDRSQDALYEAKRQCMIRNGVKIIIV